MRVSFPAMRACMAVWPVSRRTTEHGVVKPLKRPPCLSVSGTAQLRPTRCEYRGSSGCTATAVSPAVSAPRL